MANLRIELRVRDYDLWRDAFGRDAGGRQRLGVRRYRILRPVDDLNSVMLDLDFDTAKEPEGFLDFLRNDVWPSPERRRPRSEARRRASSKMVESNEY